MRVAVLLCACAAACADALPEDMGGGHGSVWWEWYTEATPGCSEPGSDGDDYSAADADWMPDGECVSLIKLKDDDPLKVFFAAPNVTLSARSNVIDGYTPTAGEASGGAPYTAARMFCYDPVVGGFGSEGNRVARDDVLMLQLFSDPSGSCLGPVWNISRNQSECVDSLSVRFHCSRCHWVFRDTSSPPYFLQAIGVFLFLVVCIAFNLLFQQKIDHCSKVLPPKLLPCCFSMPDTINRDHELYDSPEQKFKTAPQQQPSPLAGFSASPELTRRDSTASHLSRASGASAPAEAPPVVHPPTYWDSCLVQICAFQQHPQAANSRGSSSAAGFEPLRSAAVAFEPRSPPVAVGSTPAGISPSACSGASGAAPGAAPPLPPAALPVRPSAGAPGATRHGSTYQPPVNPLQQVNGSSRMSESGSPVPRMYSNGFVTQSVSSPTGLVTGGNPQDDFMARSVTGLSASVGGLRSSSDFATSPVLSPREGPVVSEAVLRGNGGSGGGSGIRAVGLGRSQSARVLKRGQRGPGGPGSPPASRRADPVAAAAAAAAAAASATSAAATVAEPASPTSQSAIRGAGEPKDRRRRPSVSFATVAEEDGGRIVAVAEPSSPHTDPPSSPERGDAAVAAAAAPPPPPPRTLERLSSKRSRAAAAASRRSPREASPVQSRESSPAAGGDPDVIDVYTHHAAPDLSAMPAASGDYRELEPLSTSQPSSPRSKAEDRSMCAVCGSTLSEPHSCEEWVELCMSGVFGSYARSLDYSITSQKVLCSFMSPRNISPTQAVNVPLMERVCSEIGFAVVQEGIVDLEGDVECWVSETSVRKVSGLFKYVRVVEKPWNVCNEAYWNEWYKDFELCVGCIKGVEEDPNDGTLLLQVNFHGSATLVMPLCVFCRSSAAEHSAECLMVPQPMERRVMMAVFVASTPPLLSIKAIFLVVLFIKAVVDSMRDGHKGRAAHHNAWEAYEEVYFGLFNSGYPTLMADCTTLTSYVLINFHPSMEGFVRGVGVPSTVVLVVTLLVSLPGILTHAVPMAVYYGWIWLPLLIILRQGAKLLVKLKPAPPDIRQSDAFSISAIWRHHRGYVLKASLYYLVFRFTAELLGVIFLQTNYNYGVFAYDSHPYFKTIKTEFEQRSALCVMERGTQFASYLI